LKRHGVTSFAELCELTEDDLLKVPETQSHDIEDIKIILKKEGLSLKKAE